MGRGCYFQEGEEVRTDMKVEDAYRKSLETVMSWIGKEVNSNKTRVFFRTYAPVHFRFSFLASQVTVLKKNIQS